MGSLSTNIGFAIIGVIAVYLAVIFICNIIQDNLKKQYNKGLKDAFETIEKPVELLPELENWILKERFKTQKEMEKRTRAAELFMDDLQRMKRLEEDSEEFINKLKVVK